MFAEVVCVGDIRLEVDDDMVAGQVVDVVFVMSFFVLSAILSRHVDTSMHVVESRIPVCRLFPDCCDTRQHDNKGLFQDCDITSSRLGNNGLRR